MSVVIRAALVALVNAAAHIAEHTVMRLPNLTDSVCPVCRRTDCTKDVTHE